MHSFVSNSLQGKYQKFKLMFFSWHTASYLFSKSNTCRPFHALFKSLTCSSILLSPPVYLTPSEVAILLHYHNHIIIILQQYSIIDNSQSYLCHHKIEKDGKLLSRCQGTMEIWSLEDTAEPRSDNGTCHPACIPKVSLKYQAFYSFFPFPF